MTEGPTAPPLDVGVRTMCLNQILENEQVTLMQHAAANDAAKIKPLRRKLNMFQKLLKEHPYAHRPYTLTNSSDGQMAWEANEPSGLIPGLAAWENEGGHVEMAKSQKRSNREIRKPKAEKPKTGPKPPVSPVSELMKKPKGKL